VTDKEGADAFVLPPMDRFGPVTVVVSGSDKDRLCEGDRDGPGCRGHAVSLRATSSIASFLIGIVPNFVIDCNYWIFSSQLENVSAVSCSNSFDDPERVAP
jgi:hypothetical protein